MERQWAISGSGVESSLYDIYEIGEDCARVRSEPPRPEPKAYFAGGKRTNECLIY